MPFVKDSKVEKLAAVKAAHELQQLAPPRQALERVGYSGRSSENGVEIP